MLAPDALCEECMMRMNFVQPSWPKFAFQEHPEEASKCLDPSSSSFCLKSKANDNDIEFDPHHGDEVDYFEQ
jgi:hypothetical protein